MDGETDREIDKSNRIVNRWELVVLSLNKQLQAQPQAQPQSQCYLGYVEVERVREMRGR